MAPRWVGVCVTTLVLLMCLCTTTTLALVRIPLQRPPSRPPRLHRLHRPSPPLLHDAPRPQPPLAMMQAEEGEGDATRPRRHYAHLSRLSHLPLHNVEDYLYTATIALGSPPQNFTILLDTGSTDAWVPGQRCATCGASHRHFDRRRSHSFADLHTPFEGLYGSGSSRGDVVKDTLRLGEKAVVPGFVFALITSETGDIPSFPTDGVLGLAFRGMSKIDDRRLPTLLDAMAKATESPVFAFQLTTTDDDAPSEFHFGGVDLSRVGAQPQIAYFPVITLPIDSDLTFWTIALQSFRVVDSATGREPDEDEELDLHHHSSSSNERELCTPFCYAIVDSGTSLIYAPPQIYDAVIARITKRLRDCDPATLQCRHTTRDAFPSLAFSFGSGRNSPSEAASPAPANVFTLRPESYVSCDEDGGGSVCTINILNHAEMGDDLFWWVLGDTFLQSFYTVFDVGQRRVGIACDAASRDCRVGASATGPKAERIS